MQPVLDLYLAHPFWIWVGIAAALLALEITTGTGWLLWPSASAAVIALANLAGLHLGMAGDVIAFAVLTIASTLITRRLAPKHSDDGNINDRSTNLVGKTGHAVDGGRVLVDGAEWQAEVDGGATLTSGAKVEVTGVLGGAKLAVRAV
ncbi:NfeD family protein [soil metagenome]